MKFTKSKLFTAVESDTTNAIPEEGSLSNQEDTPQESAPVDTPEPQEEQAAPVEPTDPGQESEIDTDLQSAEADDEKENEVAEQAELEMTQTAGDEIQRITVTLETFSEIIEQDEPDAVSRQMIDDTLATIESNYGFHSEAVPATEAVSEWKQKTQKRLDSLKHELSGAVKVANEGIWDKITAALGSLKGKIAVVDSQLKEAQEALNALPDGDLEVDPLQFPRVFPLYSDPSKQSFTRGLDLVAGSADILAGLISQTISNKMSLDGWEAALRRHFSSVQTTGGFKVDFANNIGPKAIFGVFTHFDESSRGPAFWYYKQELAERGPIRTKGTVKVSKQERLKLLKTASDNIEYLRKAHQWLTKAVVPMQNDLALVGVAEVRYKLFTLVSVTRTCISQVIPLELAAYRELLQLVK